MLGSVGKKNELRVVGGRLAAYLVRIELESVLREILLLCMVVSFTMQIRQEDCNPERGIVVVSKHLEG